MKREGICALCQEHKELLQSHIIPKACYKDPYKRYAPLTMIYPESTNHPYKSLQGVYGFFLCDECEKKFNKSDNDGFNILYREKAIEYIVPNPWNSYQYYKIYETYDEDNQGLIKQIKLFVLAILWRAAVSNRKEFHSVKLTENILEQGRQIFLNSNTGILENIDVAISRFDDGSNLFIFPTKQHYDGIDVFRICLPYYTLLVKIDVKPFPHALHSVSLNGLNTILAINRNWQTSIERRVICKFYHSIWLERKRPEHIS